MLYPNEQKVSDARLAYYAKNGIPPDGGASDKIGKGEFGPITLYVPNFPARVAALERHDLHHIILDADTSLRGEAVVGAFETAAGCGKFWVAWFLEPQNLVFGLFLCPLETAKAFALGRRSKSLYHGPFRREWLEMSVGDLRKMVLGENRISFTAADALTMALWAVVGMGGLLTSILFLRVPAVIYLLRSMRVI